MRDLIIRNGTIVDGTGGAPFVGDVAIEGERIVEVGQVTGEARLELDVHGLIVTPGWVDIHTHYDGQATWDPLLAPSSWHGVTTAIMGNCGVGFAPVRAADREFLVQLMEGVEDIPGTALFEGIDWSWERFPEYLDALERKPRAIDIGVQVPHGPVRAYVLGERSNTDYVPNAAEIGEMAELTREGIVAGALGISVSRTLLHRDKNGIHVPGTFAGSDEMLAMGLAMKEAGGGVFQMVSDNLGDDNDEWAWIKQFAKDTELLVTLVTTFFTKEDRAKVYGLAEKARCDGMNVRPQTGARPLGILHGLQSRLNIFADLPTYKREIEKLPLAGKVAAMQQPEIRAALLSEVTPGLDSLGGDLSNLFPLGENPQYEPNRDQSVAALAEAKGVSPEEMMYDLLIRDGGIEMFYRPWTDFEFFHQIMAHPNMLFGLSDAGAHCGVIADASMPTFILTHWVRDRARGEKFPLEFVVRKLTSEAAEAYGLMDRGEIKPGMLADINVIDMQRLRLFRPEAVNDLPTGGMRLVQRVEGYRYTIKSGQVTFEDGQFTGALPGGLVRGPRSASARGQVGAEPALSN